MDIIGTEGIKKLFHDAPLNHCLTFEQVAGEVIGHFKIPTGNFDTITNCKYSIPSYTNIGRLYSYLILEETEDGDYLNTLAKIFTSFISDEISDFKTGVYVENTSYLLASYHVGKLL